MKFKQSGSILIMVLWLIMLGLILVTALASNVRLSAKTVINHQRALNDWSKTLAAINKAHMEILISKMNPIKVTAIGKGKEKEKNNRFDGQILKLKYKTPEGLSVRIYDLSGKINVLKLNKTNLIDLLKHRLGEFDKRIPSLVDAWFDWIDANDLKRLNGAEKKYYQKEKLDYIPRNGQFESVDEILLIRGFKEVFNGINLGDVFSLYGGRSYKVNPNQASKEVLVMIPGITAEVANEIIKARETQEFKNINDLNILLPVSTINKAKSWFNMQSSQYYRIAVYPTAFEQDESNKKTVTAYVEDVFVRNAQEAPKVIKVMPSEEINID